MRAPLCESRERDFPEPSTYPVKTNEPGQRPRMCTRTRTVVYILHIMEGPEARSELPLMHWMCNIVIGTWSFHCYLNIIIVCVLRHILNSDVRIMHLIDSEFLIF